MIVLHCEGCRIELIGEFAEQDAECLLREFPELKCFEVPEGQLSFFDQEVDYEIE